MFRLDTGQARVDLFNEPLDLSVAERSLSEQRTIKADKEAAKAKQEDARLSDLETNMSKMGSVKIMPRDQQMFADQAEGIRDYVEKNHEALRNGDVKTNMEFQRLYGDYNTKAEMSKNARENWEQAGLQFQKDSGSYLPESEKAYWDFASSDNAGNFQFDPTTMVKKINYIDRVQKELLPIAKERAQATQTPWKETFTPEESDKLIETDILSDPALMVQADSEFKNATDKKGATNAVDYMKKTYSSYLPQNQRKAGPSTSGDTKDKTPKVSVVVAPIDGGGTKASFNFTDKAENPPMTVDNPEVPGEAMQITPMALIRKPNGDVILKGSVKITNEDGDVKNVIKEVDYGTVEDVMINTYGIKNPQELFEGTGPAHVTIKKYEAGKGGKSKEKPTFTKAELEAKAKAAGYTYKEYLELVKDKVTLK